MPSPLDRPFAYDPGLAAPRVAAIDTAPLDAEGDRHRARPRRRAAAAAASAPAASSTRSPVKRLHQPPSRIPAAHPRHGRGARPAGDPRPLIRLGVDAVELMPIAAWIDERHLPAARARPTPGATIPSPSWRPIRGSAPGGLAEMRAAVAALHAAGIGVILDVVFNHTGESDALRPDAVAARPRQRALLPPRRGDPARSSTTPAPATRSPATSPPVMRARPRCAAALRAARPASTASASISRRCSAARRRLQRRRRRSSPRSTPTRSSPTA